MNKDKYTAGMAVRREVLGDEYVDKAMSGTINFTKPLQDLITGFAGMPFCIWRLSAVYMVAA